MSRDLWPYLARWRLTIVTRMESVPVLEDLSVDECLALLRRRVVGRVGTTIGALPAVLPVNYAMIGRDIVFRSAPGTKLTAAVLNTPVAFEVDDLDEVGRVGWSVMVVGRATEVVDPVDLETVGGLPLEPWAPGGRDHIVRVRTEYVTGRRIVRRQETSTSDDPDDLDEPILVE